MGKDSRKAGPIVMKTITIDATNKIAIHSGDIEIADGGVKFTTEAGFAEVTSTWPGTRFVELWNNLPGVTRITKFKDRKTAILRIWAAIEKMEPTSSLDTPGPSAKKPARKEAASGSKTD